MLTKKVSLGFVFASLLAASAEAAPPFIRICFVPGMGGRTPYIFDDVAAELARRGIAFKGYDIGVIGTIQERAQRFADALADDVKRDPSFSCHLVSHSLGGIVARYSVAHLQAGASPLRNYVTSVTTISTPHKGTPLASLLQFVLPNLVPGLEVLSEESIAQFNDPAYPETYSPAVPGLPYFSYRSYLKNWGEAETFGAKMGFVYLWGDLLRLKRDPLNDGMIPWTSQDFGEVLSNVHVEHAYFGGPTQIPTPVSDFYEMHAHFLNGTLESFKTSEPQKWRALRTMLDVQM